MYDCIIIGAGPAGLTAGIYCLRAGLKVLILEKAGIGGQIASSPLVENYPGLISVSGLEIANNLYKQVIDLGGKIEFEEVLKIESKENKKITTDYNTYETKVVIIATGVKHRLLGITTEDKFLGNGISFCATCDGAFFKDQLVAVIGGGNTAASEALYLSNVCKKVYLIYRKNALKCEKILLEQINKKNNIEILYNSRVEKFLGNNKLESIIVNGKKIDLSGVFLSIGMEASTDFIKNLITLDSDDYIMAKDCETNIDGVFAAGDCRQKQIRQLTTAVSDGTIAAIKAIDYIKLI